MGPLRVLDARERTWHRVAADAKGTAALVLCLSLGALYQQAPKRKTKTITASPENTPLISAGSGPKV
jgi:hypothetical protein